ncbi:hypothetical protein ATCC90586_004619 [Pythium insidiosum]|nr:hypothetical protein ATCC90586_004619 [Pythium insidiosum]
MAGKSWFWISLATLVALLAFSWPSIELQLRAHGVDCPWPFNLFHAQPTPDPNDGLKRYTLEELRRYDGSNADLPILLSLGGKVLDVSKGAKFYAPGRTYHQFAGTACTRALTLSSLDKKDISDDVSDFTDEQRKDMEDTLQFYLEKYPVVGVLVPN